MDHALRQSVADAAETGNAIGADSKLPITWTAHPLREQLGVGLLGLIIVSLLAASTAVLAGHVAWGVCSAIILILTLQRFYFPSNYRIDEQGISVSHLLSRRTLRWSDLRRFDHDDESGVLARRAHPSKWTRTGEIHVMFGGQSAGLIQIIEDRLNDGGAS